MKNLKKSEKILLLILAFALVFYLYYTFLLNPIINQVSASRSNITAYNNELENIRLKESQLTKLKANYETYKSDYEKLTKRFPVFEKDPEIGLGLKILADKSNVIIQSQSYLAANSADPGKDTKTNTTGNPSNSKAAANKKYNLNYVPVNVNVSGSYENIRSFINSLENEERSTIISIVNINKTESSLTASISANFYFIADSQNTEKNSYDFNNKIYGKSDLFN